MDGQQTVVVKANGDSNGKVGGSLADILSVFQIASERVISAPFLEPRGLVNTGNMCFMNAVSYSHFGDRYVKTDDRV